MLGCELTVFAAMVEYGYLLYVDKFKMPKIAIKVSDNNSDMLFKKISDPTMSAEMDQFILKADKKCFASMVILFAIFNLAFWLFVGTIKQ